MEKNLLKVARLSPTRSLELLLAYAYTPAGDRAGPFHHTWFPQ